VRIRSGATRKWDAKADDAKPPDVEQANLLEAPKGPEALGQESI